MSICAFCEQEITDGREESGFTGIAPDWMVDDDFGCDRNPISGEDGTGSHFTQVEVNAILKYALANLNTDEIRENLYRNNIRTQR